MAMTQTTIRRWYLVHKWTSLICTAFLLVICLTGLPLIFQDEIGDYFDDALPYAAVPAGTPAVSIDSVVAASRAMFPKEAVLFVFVDDDDVRFMDGLETPVPDGVTVSIM